MPVAVNVASSAATAAATGNAAARGDRRRFPQRAPRRRHGDNHSLAAAGADGLFAARLGTLLSEAWQAGQVMDSCMTPGSFSEAKRWSPWNTNACNSVTLHRWLNNQVQPPGPQRNRDLWQTRMRSHRL